MKKLDRLILKSFIGPFVAILFVVLFVLVMQFLWVYIDELVGKGLSLKVVAEFLLWGSCTILPLALPLATLLAAMMTMGQMAENSELIAAKAAGISITRIMTPLIIASAVISVGAFFASNNLVPFSYNRIYTLRDDIGRTKEEIKIPAGIFYDGIDNYVLRVDSNDEETGVMRGVMVYDHSANKGNNTVTLADSAVLRMSKSKDYLTFIMYNGVNYVEENTIKPNSKELGLERISFDKQELIIPLKNYAFERSEENKYGDQVMAMDLTELRADRDSMQAKFDTLHLNQVNMFYDAINMYKSHQFDTAYFRQPLELFEYENFMEWETEEDEINALERAGVEAYEISSELNNFNRDLYEYVYELRRAGLEILRKYSKAIACLLLFFIGAPLGALIRKGGLGTPAIISALFFVLYYIVDLIGAKMTKNGVLDPVNGAFLPAYLLIPLGILLTSKAVHDSSFLNMDAVKTRWNTIKGYIAGLFRKTRIVYMGTPEFAVAPLDALVKNGKAQHYKVVGVVTVADKQSGRGLQVNQSAVKKYAVENGIPVLQPVKLKDPEFLASLAALKADLFVVVAFRMLPEEVWAMPKLGTFNLHAALLPQYRGAAPINWAVINGEKMTGVTTFMLDKNIDTGMIIFREEHKIAPTDTAGDVHDALMEKGTALVLQTVRALIDHNVEMRVQKSFIQGSEELKPAPKITRETCCIDWNRSTEDVYNLIRGLSPYPTAFTFIQRPEDENPVQLKVFFGEKMPSRGLAPGQIESDGKSYIAIGTADGAISVTDIQLAGKKRMNVHEFLLGFRGIEGAVTVANRL
ncbi:MAG: methionyl-tRNA formyltransferase [Bacteroidales bacterium]|nr:methionyl-tRNA formyltransferase [Bacteroidales bacterium]MBQ5416859.1 methionyl-tRNA formyltransferase [Bacteroidales bacterium]